MALNGRPLTYVSPLTQFLLGATDIPRTFMILGLGATVLICLFARILTNPPGAISIGTRCSGAGSFTCSG